MARPPKAILFVEFHKRKDTIFSAREYGYKTILLTSKKDPALADCFDEIRSLDLQDKEDIDQLAQELKKKYLIKGILSNYEHFVVQRSYLAECFGIPSTSVYGACCTRNKVMQREALRMLEENIEYNIVETYEQACEAFENLDQDVYLKSIAGIKSRFVRHIHSSEGLQEAWEDFQDAHLTLDPDLFNDFDYLDFDFPYPDPKKNLLVEKTYTGQQIAIASLVSGHHYWHAPSPTDVYSARDIGRKDSFLAFRILPSKLSPQEVEEANAVVEKIITVLGLKHCAIHAELLFTPDGSFKIIEAASRLGGYRGYMYKEVYGIDLPKMLIRSVIDQPVKIRRKKAQQFLSFMEIFPENEGLFVGIKGLEELEKDSQIDRLDIRVQPGEQVGRAMMGYPPVVVFAIKGASYKEVYEKSIQYQNDLRVQLS